MHREKVSEPAGKGREARKAGRVASSLVSWFASLLFVALILFAAVVVYLTGAQENHPRALFGYSAFIVLSGSMRSEIPQGSFVLVRDTDPAEIQIGDDITYIRADNSLITHRVVGIAEDDGHGGTRGFVTQGIDNPEPDRETVIADNVVGRVIFHDLLLGSILAFVHDHVWLTVLAAALLLALYYALWHMVHTFRKPKLSDSVKTQGPAPKDTEGGSKPGGQPGGQPSGPHSVIHAVESGN